MKLSIFSISILVLTFIGCSSKSNTLRKPVTNIQITPASNIILHGNDFDINLQTKTHKADIDYIELYINDKIIGKTKDQNYFEKIDSKTLLPGKHTIKVVAIDKKGQIGINYANVSILSEFEPSIIDYELITSFYHDPKNFTQGLEFYNGSLFESTGDHGTSYIYQYNSKFNKIIKELKIEDQYFGEGITILNDKIYQLTYKHKVGFIYNSNSFAKIGQFTFNSNEGWGLTNDGEYLIMSDGTSTIKYIDPNDFSVVKTIQVTHPKGFVTNLNELEYVNGYIYANIWTTDQIVKFDAQNGKVIGYLDLSALKNSFINNNIDVLNGIAFNKSEKLFYITGKLWPTMFKIRLIE